MDPVEVAVDGEQAAGALRGGKDWMGWQEQQQQQQRQQERRNGECVAFNASLVSLSTS